MPASCRSASRRCCGALDGVPPLGPGTATPDRDIRARLEMLLAVDEGLERIVATLEETGSLDRTVVIVTSDHGYFYGEHGLNEERRLAYEESARIPLIVALSADCAGGMSRPPRWSRRSISPRRCCELAGVADPTPREGRSLVPLVARRTACRGERRC